MQFDLSTSHERFAAYEMEYPSEKPWWWDEYVQGQQEATDYTRQTRQEDVDYRNRALSQSGSNARLAASTSRQNASLAASTSRANAQLAARTQLKNTQMQIDHQYKVFRERLNELEIPTMNLDAWYKNAQIGIAKARLQLEARGPRNALQYSAAMGQVSDIPNIPASFAAIARNTPYAIGGPSGTPEALTYDDLARKYGIPGAGGGTATPDGQMQADQTREQALRSMFKDVIARGPQGLAPGVYESLPGWDQEIFKSALEDAGADADDWLQRRERFGIGQMDPRAA